MQGDDGQYREGLGFALWALWIAGLAGIHRIYLGKYGTGILYLLTFGLFGVGQIVDLFRMKTLVREANIREGYLPHPRVASYLVGISAHPGGRTRESRSGSACSNPPWCTEEQSPSHRAWRTPVPPSRRSRRPSLDLARSTGYVDVDNAPGTGVVIYRFTELS